MVALGEADVFEVVVLAAGPHAFLRGRGARVLALFEAQEDVLELIHPGVGEEQRGISMRHQRRAAHTFVPLALKEAQEHLANLTPAESVLLMPARGGRRLGVDGGHF